MFSQPGIRYSQAEALIKSLMQDEKFRNMSLTERSRVTEHILDEIKGRMMEDIVLLETKLSSTGILLTAKSVTRRHSAMEILPESTLYTAEKPPYVLTQRRKATR